MLTNVLNVKLQCSTVYYSKSVFSSTFRFYRYVLEPEPQFTEAGDMTAGPYARFTGLPESSILTLNYHAPENWLVEVVKSVYDLDNIKLDLVETGVHRYVDYVRFEQFIICLIILRLYKVKVIIVT